MFEEEKEIIFGELIANLSEILPDYYSKTEIKNLALKSDVLDYFIEDGTKKEILQNFFLYLNKNYSVPLKIVGEILEDFIDKGLNKKGRSYERKFKIEDDWKGDKANPQWTEDCEEIKNTLIKKNLEYIGKGIIVKRNSIATNYLIDRSKNNNKIEAIKIEVERAIENIENDPAMAIQFARNALESVFKIYLKENGIEYKENDENLRKKVFDSIGINKSNSKNDNVKKIISGFNTIVQSLFELRNKDSSGHGRAEVNPNILPRHARLAVSASHTIVNYILDFMEK